jgi:hypothetical protein
MAKKRVFISFDYDHDKALKELVSGQAKRPDSPYEIVDFSTKLSTPEKDWIENARKGISQSDVFILMLGPKTKKTAGVLKEFKIAMELKKMIIQIIGYKFGIDDWAVPGAGNVYKWDWENLKKVLS